MATTGLGLRNMQPLTGLRTAQDSSNANNPPLNRLAQRRTSSIYSNSPTSPNFPTFPPKLRIEPTAPSVVSAISPPGSPSGDGDDKDGSPNISPVTAAGSIFHGQQPVKTTPLNKYPLPTPPTSGSSPAPPIRIRAANERSTSSGSSRADKTRTLWDKYSGEPTDSSRGKAGTTAPGSWKEDEFGVKTAIIGGVAVTLRSTKSAAAKERTPSLSKDTSKLLPQSPPLRSERKGPVGRFPVVASVAEAAREKTKQFFPSNSSVGRTSIRSSSAPNSIKHREDLELRAPSPRKPVDEKPLPIVSASEVPSMGARVDFLDSPLDLTPDQAQYVVIDSAQQSIRESVMDKNSIRESVLLDTRSTSPTPSYAPMSDAGSWNDRELDHRIPPPVRERLLWQPVPNAPRIESSIVPLSQHERERITMAFQTLGLANEPQSHFSATTYASSYAERPPTVPDTPPQATPSPPSPEPVSILNRKRPIRPARSMGQLRNASRGISRKPTPSNTMKPGFSVPASTETEASPTTPPTSPPTPQDRITYLQDQIERKERRKRELKSMIYQLTNIETQASDPLYDAQSRASRQQTANLYRTELSDVEKQIHELGVMLFRALKKRDEVNFTQPTQLWVKRIYD